MNLPSEIAYVRIEYKRVSEVSGVDRVVSDGRSFFNKLPVCLGAGGQLNVNPYFDMKGSYITRLTVTCVSRIAIRINCVINLMRGR